MPVAIDHLGIAVESLEEALRFYSGALGMTVSGQETVEAERVRVAMLPAGSGADASRIELLEASDAGSPVARFIAKRGPGLHHVALQVDDLTAVVKRLQDAGFDVIGEPRRGAGGHLYVFVHPASASGVLVELIQAEQRTKGNQDIG